MSTLSIDELDELEAAIYRRLPLFLHVNVTKAFILAREAVDARGLSTAAASERPAVDKPPDIRILEYK